MPFPNTIDASATVSAVQGPSPPMEIGGSLYQILIDFATDIITAYKSTDHGVTWVSVDAANGPKTTTMFCAATDGTIIYVPYADDFGTGNTNVRLFDPGSDTWTTDVPTTNIGLSASTNNCGILFRAVDSNLVISSQQTVAGHSRCYYFLFDTLAHTFTPWTPYGETNPGVTEAWLSYAVVRGNGCVHFVILEVDNDGAGPGCSMRQQALSDGGVLGAIQTVETFPTSPPPDFPCGVGDGTNIILGWTPDGANSQLAHTFKGASSTGVIAFTQQNLDRGAGQISPGDSLTFVAKSGSFFALVFSLDSATFTVYTLFSFVDSGSGFGSAITEGSNNTGIHFFAARWAGPVSFAAWGLLLEASAYFWASGAIPPPPVSTTPAKASVGGGTYFPRFVNKTLLHAQIARVVGRLGPISYRQFAPLYWLYDFPNEFDVCLSREWRLYNEIDPQALSCARKPDCFTGDMGLKPWVDAPAGAITFNPDKAIPLPNPALVDVVVLSFRVPLGFDGILLAQYHGYVGGGTFVEGSGDLVWRVRANGRYLRDMGDMEFSIGSPQTLSPCPGGLWLHSGNLVEYLVSAPNGSGSLPLPGEGNILAGLHGWFFPRV